MGKPYFVFVPLFLIVSISGFFATEEMLDINVHDTYYVIAEKHFYWLLSLLLFLNFIVFFSFEKLKIDLYKSLTTVQILIFVMAMIGLFFPYYLIFKDEKFPLFESSDRTNFCVSISVFLLIISQFIIIINIFASIIKYSRVLRIK